MLHRYIYTYILYYYTPSHFFDQELIQYRCHLIVLLAVVLVCSVVSNRIGMKFGRIVLRENTHRLTESDF